MFSRFFIDRPIFASVLSIVITLAGAIALFTLPVAMYPQIAPPTVSVTCNYPGANAQVVAETVATPIEQQVNGVEDMLYMSSQCTNDGGYTLTVTFKHGVDLNMAQVLVQNRVNLALPMLPDVIKQTGVTTRKRSPDILMSVAINSPGGRYDQLYLSNYALIQVKDELSRLPGVSDVSMLGQRDYSMRIWLDPNRMAARDMAASDVVTAIRRQNTQVATGQIGQQPAPNGQMIQIPISTLGRLSEVSEYEKIIVKVGRHGHVVRLKDVARVELGAKNQDINCQVNGRPSVSLALFQLPDANALDTAVIAKAKMAELATRFPAGLQYEIRYDTTPFITESVNEVFKTLRDAIALVAIVVLLFLQNWRSAIIPLVAVPVAIIGTFAVMAAAGFSLNNLTLFGLVLAIGIVVDDAIVVVEAVELHIARGLSPRDATIQAMQEVSGPVVAIGLVLTAVFVPCAFISGIVGQFFRQFALTIAASTVISTFNSLTLSPALAAMLLKPHHDHESSVRKRALPRVGYGLIGAWTAYEFLGERYGERLEHLAAGWPGEAWWYSLGAIVGGGLLVGILLGKLLDRALVAFFGVFNRGFEASTRGYIRGMKLLIRGSLPVLLIYVGLLYSTYHGFVTTPKGFIPSQDMGYLLVNVQLPDSASAERTQAVMNSIEKIALSTPGVKFTQTMGGQSLLLSANGSNFGSMFAVLDSFANRRTPELYGDAIAARLRKSFEAEVPDGVMTVLGPPPLRGVGRAGGFKLMIEDRGDNGSQLLQEQTDNLVDEARKQAIKATNDDWMTVRFWNEKYARWSGKPPGPAGAKGAGAAKVASKDGGKDATKGDAAKAAPGKAQGGPPPGMRPALVGLASVFRANVPQIFVDVNRAECMRKEVALRDLFDTMRTYLGSLYVNDFNKFGRTWQVVVQADQKFRDTREDVRRLKVRNLNGGMVPLGALADVREVNGPLILTRYNMSPAAPINGSAAPGVSSGEAIAMMEKLANEQLLPSMSFEWTELAYLELQAGSTAMIVFGFAVAMVFLVLAAQYESWSMPLAIILVLPMCLLSSIIGVRYASQDVNIFTQIGFVVLVGLASKNAILIVEFAKSRRDQGASRTEAALEACELRLRPIVMTSLAFILGVVPLLLAKGAGAEMRRTLGTTVFSGMVGVTMFGLLLTPVFFVVIDYLGSSRVFSSRLGRIVFGLPLAIISLSPLRHGSRVVYNALSKKPARPPVVGTADDELPTDPRRAELVEQE
ncbi:efflux RND transporter permease subunit [Isosphaeraceae bacterium EP7]